MPFCTEDRKDRVRRKWVRVGMGVELKGQDLFNILKNLQ
jgi:hypothetical protein